MAVKKKIVVFDFNRTLYDPERRVLIKGVLPVLKSLVYRGYALYVVSTAAPSRHKLMKDLGLGEYFEKMVVTNNKKKSFDLLLKNKSIDLEKSFVVGDRVRKEIRYGNLAGLKTVWVRAGKFAKETPRFQTEKPNHKAKNIRAILKILK